MTERARIPDMGSQKIVDTTYSFKGTWDKEPEGRCRLRILDRPAQPPILILTELNTNPSTSVTNMAEVLVAEVIARYMPQRFEVVDEDPAFVIEHYEPMKDGRGRRGKPTYDRILFTSWVPRKVWLGGQERLSLSEPDWRHLPDHEVRELLGDEADDVPPTPPRPADDEHLEAAHDDRVSGFDE
jgi:hypothetical protein